MSIERYDDGRGHMPADMPAQPPGLPLAADYRDWLPALQSASAIAREIASTEFVPEALRDAPAAVAACILAGRELQLGPMASLQHIHVIEGRPALSAEMARAMILAHGHTLRWREIGNSRVVLAGRRAGDTDWTTVTWTWDDARRARLTQRRNWERYPRRMLQARATGELARLVFADCLAGMGSQLVEEVDDDTDDAGPGEAAPRRTIRRRTAVHAPPAGPSSEGAKEEAEQPAGPPLPGEEADDGADDGSGVPPVTEWKEPASEAQLRRLHTALAESGLTDRDQRLRVAAAIVGRPGLASSRELTKREASVLLDTLATVLRNAQTGDDAGNTLLQLAAEAEQEAAEAQTEEVETELGEANEATAEANASQSTLDAESG